MAAGVGTSMPEVSTRAKVAGVYLGRKPSIDPAQVKALKVQGMGVTEIAKVMGIGWGSVYRLLDE